MKCRNTILSILIGLSLAAGTLTSQAQIISVNFQNAANTTPLLAASDSTGVVSASNWNNIDGVSGSATALVNSSNAATTLNLGYSSLYGTALGYTPGSPTPYNLMYASRIESAYSTGDTQTFAAAIGGGRVTLSLTTIPYATYDIYVYVANAPGYIYQSTSTATIINTAPKIGYTAANTGSFVEGGNYVKFSGLTGATQYLYAGAVNPADIGGFNSGIAGFQIVAVPEPSTWALLALGCASLVGVARRHKQ